jgi:hypothetical protein
MSVVDDGRLFDLPPLEPASLLDRWGVPPFSVLDSRQGYWRERRQQWIALGIESFEGRAVHTEEEDDSKGLLYRSSGARDSSFYRQKRETEARLGRELTYAEFESEHYVNHQHGSGLSQTGTSVFDPVLCESVYRWFSAPGSRILDPFAGGSVRGIIAGLMRREYVGVDLSSSQVEANKRQAREVFGSLDESTYVLPTWLVGDARTIAEEAEYDLAFSCPPYYNLEVYSNDPRDLSHMPPDDFEFAYILAIRRVVSALRPDRFACFVVGDVRDSRGIYRNFPGKTIRAFLSAGAKLYNEAIFLQEIGSLPVRAGRPFAATRKLGKAHQNVLVFVKGDPRKAAEHCASEEIVETFETGEGVAA